MNKQVLLRALPKVDALIGRVTALPEGAGIPYAALLGATRGAVDRLRKDILSGEVTALPTEEALLGEVLRAARRQAAFSLRPVINATGIVLHTNLGRSALGERVAEHIKQVAMGYSTLEYDLQSATRGSRHSHIEGLLCRLTGAEAALVVNNNAAAVLLMLTALCAGREVVVSRGELVEIGGSFRVPEVMAQGGAILREVGTTNKTHLRDYEAAIDPEVTGALLKVHTSNYKVVGFTGEVDIAALSRLGRDRGIPVLYDLGSGALAPLGEWGPALLGSEPTAAEQIRRGADLVCFSGDKLLGGPQAGIVVGKKALIDKLKTHPLARALRIDKLTLSALEATLRLYLEPQEALAHIPTLNMLCISDQQLSAKAHRLLEALPPGDYGAEVQPTQGQAGGGSFPGQDLPSYAVAVLPEAMSLEQLERCLREFEVPIIARIYKERLLLDVRTIDDGQFSTISRAFALIFSKKEGQPHA